LSAQLALWIVISVLVGVEKLSQAAAVRDEMEFELTCHLLYLLWSSAAVGRNLPERLMFGT
jgi:hypothetical protein